MNIDKKVVNFLGDSITEGQRATSYEKCFVGRFASAHPTSVVNNYGIGGTRIAPQRTPSLHPKHDLDFLGRVDQMDDRADLVCVFGGTNDFGHGDAPFGKFGDETPDTFCGALRCLTLKLLNKYPSKKIAFFTPLHRITEATGAPLSPDKKLLKDYVDEIRKNAEYFSLPLLDLWSMSGMQPCVPIINETYFTDGLHPNDLGHEKLFNIVDAFIRSLE